MDERVEENPWFHQGLKFQCTGCGKCCSGPSGYVFLSLEDLSQLAAHFNVSEEIFSKKYTQRVDGMLALLDQSSSSDCIFLKDNKCSVYEARPSQCRTFPWWIHHLREPAEWEKAALSCEGINHKDAPIVASLEIQKQCFTYLDHVIDENFSF